MNVAFTIIEVGILPLSFLIKIAVYNGRLMKTNVVHKKICNANISTTLSFSPFSANINLLSKSTIVKKFTIARQVNMVNIGEGTPKSMIPFSYLLDTSSSVTFVVITNSILENPRSLRIASNKAKR
uniref:Uncharacterized protein n=1 Tax=Opuntia streptacantha TaxID=393608 RepID=A0A7C9AZE4_OPUST